MARSPALCRRRWARRGRGLADFVFGFALTALAHVFINAWRSIYGFAAILISKRTRNGVRGPGVVEGCARRSGAETELASEHGFAPLAERPSVHFDDIAGLNDAKREIRLRMILPLLHPEKAALYGIRQGGGLLLYGPPGTGKTMLAKAVAAECDARFYHIRPSDIMAAQVGQAEANIDRLFRTLRREKRAVLFIDEIEALVPSRRRNGSTIMQRVISQILGEVDGLAGAPDGHVLLLIGATNEPGMIDPAMMRPGRFDAKIFVGLPNQVARAQMLRSNLNSRPIGVACDIDLLASRTAGMSGADIKALVGEAADRAFLASLRNTGEPTPIDMDDFQRVLDSGPRAADGHVEHRFPHPAETNAPRDDRSSAAPDAEVAGC